jgi:hypothetical protein
MVRTVHTLGISSREIRTAELSVGGWLMYLSTRRYVTVILIAAWDLLRCQHQEHEDQCVADAHIMLLCVECPSLLQFVVVRADERFSEMTPSRMYKVFIIDPDSPHTSEIRQTL